MLVYVIVHLVVHMAVCLSVVPFKYNIYNRMCGFEHFLVYVSHECGYSGCILCTVIGWLWAGFGLCSGLSCRVNGEAV